MARRSRTSGWRSKPEAPASPQSGTLSPIGGVTPLGTSSLTSRRHDTVQEFEPSKEAVVQATLTVLSQELKNAISKGLVKKREEISDTLQEALNTAQEAATPEGVDAAYQAGIDKTDEMLADINRFDRVALEHFRNTRKDLHQEGKISPRKSALKQQAITADRINRNYKLTRDVTDSLETQNTKLMWDTIDQGLDNVMNDYATHGSGITEDGAAVMSQELIDHQVNQALTGLEMSSDDPQRFNAMAQYLMEDERILRQMSPEARMTRLAQVVERRSQGYYDWIHLEYVKGKDRDLTNLKMFGEQGEQYLQALNDNGILADNHHAALLQVKRAQDVQLDKNYEVLAQIKHCMKVTGQRWDQCKNPQTTNQDVTDHFFKIELAKQDEEAQELNNPPKSHTATAIDFIKRTGEIPTQEYDRALTMASPTQPMATQIAGHNYLRIMDKANRQALDIMASTSRSKNILAVSRAMFDNLYGINSDKISSENETHSVSENGIHYGIEGAEPRQTELAALEAAKESMASEISDEGQRGVLRQTNLTALHTEDGRAEVIAALNDGMNFGNIGEDMLETLVPWVQNETAHLMTMNRKWTQEQAIRNSIRNLQGRGYARSTFNERHNRSWLDPLLDTGISNSGLAWGFVPNIFALLPSERAEVLLNGIDAPHLENTNRLSITTADGRDLDLGYAGHASEMTLRTAVAMMKLMPAEDQAKLKPLIERLNNNGAFTSNFAVMVSPDAGFPELDDPSLHRGILDRMQSSIARGMGIPDTQDADAPFYLKPGSQYGSGQHPMVIRAFSAEAIRNHRGPIQLIDLGAYNSNERFMELAAQYLDKHESNVWTTWTQVTTGGLPGSNDTHFEWYFGGDEYGVPDPTREDEEPMGPNHPIYIKWTQDTAGRLDPRQPVTYGQGNTFRYQPGNRNGMVSNLLKDLYPEAKGYATEVRKEIRELRREPFPTKEQQDRIEHLNSESVQILVNEELEAIRILMDQAKEEDQSLFETLHPRDIRRMIDSLPRKAGEAGQGIKAMLTREY